MDWSKAESNFRRHAVRVQIQTAGISQNELGEQVKTWTLKAELWAQVRTLGGRELWMASQVKGESTTEFTVRWSPSLSITPADRLLMKQSGRIFDINSATDINEQHRFIQLMCKEATGDNGGG